MTAASHDTDPLPPPPAWLLRLTAASLVLALGAFVTLLTAKWAVVLALTNDVLKYCFG